MSPSPVVICPICPLSSPTLLPYLRPYSPVVTPSMVSSAPAPKHFCPVVLGVASKEIGFLKALKLHSTCSRLPRYPIPQSSICSLTSLPLLTTYSLLDCRFFAGFLVGLPIVQSKVQCALSLPAFFMRSQDPVPTTPPTLAQAYLRHPFPYKCVVFAFTCPFATCFSSFRELFWGVPGRLRRQGHVQSTGARSTQP
jgi:hypothetical protein